VTAAADSSLLVLNLGSATLKAARFDGGDLAQARGRIEIPLKDRDSNAATLLADAAGRLGFHTAPTRIGHRIVHGGDAIGARVLDASELARLQDLAGLAPLHQPPALALTASAATLWPDAAQYGVFDTAWHAGLPANARRLPVPQRWETLGIRRYGFHGLAFASALRALEAASPEGELSTVGHQRTKTIPSRTSKASVVGWGSTQEMLST
jgi:acetate kinase